MPGKRRSLADLAGDPITSAPTATAAAVGTPRELPLAAIALNPCNRRHMMGRRWTEKLAELVASFSENGQLEACAVVTRAAFLAVFPELEDRIDAAPYVHVNGARRHVAAEKLGWATLRVDVRDELAATRAAFIAATGAENINREGFDPVEEADTVQDLVDELRGSGSAAPQAAAAEKLGKTAAWVTQRLNLRKLAQPVKDALSDGEIPVRAVRDWHRLAHDEQEARLRIWRRTQNRADELTAVNDDADPEQVVERVRRSPVAVAIGRLGGTPDRIAASLKAELTPEDLQVLVEHLTTDGSEES